MAETGVLRSAGFGAKRAIALAVTGIVLATGLWLQWGPSTLTRQEATNVSLHAPSGVTVVTDRNDAKLVHRSDLAAYITDPSAHSYPWQRVWVVAAHGDLGVASTMSHARPTWSIAVVPDERPAAVEEYAGGSPEDWPPFWGKLVDLAPGK